MRPVAGENEITKKRQPTENVISSERRKFIKFSTYTPGCGRRILAGSKLTFPFFHTPSLLSLFVSFGLPVFSLPLSVCIHGNECTHRSVHTADDIIAHFRPRALLPDDDRHRFTKP